MALPAAAAGTGTAEEIAAAATGTEAVVTVVAQRTLNRRSSRIATAEARPRARQATTAAGTTMTVVGAATIVAATSASATAMTTTVAATGATSPGRPPPAASPPRAAPCGLPAPSRRSYDRRDDYDRRDERERYRGPDRYEERREDYGPGYSGYSYGGGDEGRRDRCAPRVPRPMQRGLSRHRCKLPAALSPSSLCGGRYDRGGRNDERGEHGGRDDGPRDHGGRDEREYR